MAASVATELIGYSDKWSVAPGDSIRFQVSTSADAYEAALVRLRGHAPGLEAHVPSSVDGRYAGRRQTARAGSCVVVDKTGPLQSLDSVSVAVGMWPTRVGRGVQTLLNGGAWTLALNEAGRLQFGVTTEAGPSEIVTEHNLHEREWVFVCGTYDAASGQFALRCYTSGLYARPPAVISHQLEPSPLVRGGTRLLMGASAEAPATATSWGLDHFDGKLEAPTVFDRALSEETIARLAESPEEALAVEGLVAAWRFEHGLEGDAITDVGPWSLTGRAVNAPTRAMRGAKWPSRSSSDTTDEPYTAIHFHADDLEDAGWDTDFSLRVPENLASGVYAVRLETADGSVDRIPFVVSPAPDSARARVALVLPTLTYLAYANERLPDLNSYASYRYPDGLDVTPWDAWLAEHPELGLSLYDSHADGSGCCYSSRLRPIPALRPGYLASALPIPRHFAADLFLVEWLDKSGIAFDILTDEDVDQGGVDALSPYAVVLTGSHPEYVSESILDALTAYIGSGGRLMYLGGNGFFWVTSYKQPSRHLIEVRRGQTNELPWDSCPGELRHSTSGELGGLWEHRGRPARTLVGVGFTALGMAAQPYQRTDAAYDPKYAWVFDGLPDDASIGGGGAIFGDAGGYELDRFDASLGSPARTVVLARAEGSNNRYELFLAGGSHYTKPPRGNPPFACADMTLLETDWGGAVFSVGSIAWVGSLTWNDGDNPVSTVTSNVLNGFLQDTVPTRQPA